MFRWRFWRRCLMSLPAVAVLAVFSGLLGRALYSADRVSSQYRLAARQAVASEDLAKAKFYYSRLVGAGDQGSPQDQMNWISILIASGDQESALAQLDQLAPENEIGFEPAHREKAKYLVSQVEQSQQVDPDLVKRLHWHLRQGARDSSAESDLLWAKYHFRLEQTDQALRRLESAAVRQPDLWLQIATLQRQLGRPDDASRSLSRAERHARNILDRDPLDVNRRLQLADALNQQDRFQEVGSLMEEGMRLTGNDSAMRRAASNHALMASRKLSTEDSAIEQKQMQLVYRAVSLDPNNPLIYTLLSQKYTADGKEESRDAYRKQLETWIAEGISAPYCHFALGNLLFMQGDVAGATFHFEVGLRIDPSLTIVANNLAWVLVNSDSPDVERAEQLIRTALSQDQNNVQFVDTLAAILYVKGDWKGALEAFEKVLPLAKGEKKQTLHGKLASVYENLDRPEMAATHRELAGKQLEHEQGKTKKSPAPLQD